MAISSFALGQDADKMCLPGCSWQKPYPMQEREKVDKRPKTSGKLQPPHSDPVYDMGSAEMGNSGLDGAEG